MPGDPNEDTPFSLLKLRSEELIGPGGQPIDRRSSSIRQHDVVLIPCPYTLLTRPVVSLYHYPCIDPLLLQHRMSTMCWNDPLLLLAACIEPGLKPIEVRPDVFLYHLPHPVRTSTLC